MKHTHLSTCGTAIAALFLLLFCAGVSQAQGDGTKGPGGMFERMVLQLDLTAAQKTEIQSILAEERATIKPLFESLKAGRETLRSLVKSGSYSEAELRAAAAQQTAPLIELIVVKEQTKTKILAVLNEEQRVLAEKMIDLTDTPPLAPPR